jgi:hypothetical protein
MDKYTNDRLSKIRSNYDALASYILAQRAAG